MSARRPLPDHLPAPLNLPGHPLASRLAPPPAGRRRRPPAVRSPAPSWPPTDRRYGGRRSRACTRTARRPHQQPPAALHPRPRPPELPRSWRVGRTGEQGAAAPEAAGPRPRRGQGGVRAGAGRPHLPDLVEVAGLHVAHVLQAQRGRHAAPGVHLVQQRGRVLEVLALAVAALAALQQHLRRARPGARPPASKPAHAAPGAPLALRRVALPAAALARCRGACRMRLPGRAGGAEQGGVRHERQDAAAAVRRPPVHAAQP